MRTKSSPQMYLSFGGKSTSNPEQLKEEMLAEAVKNAKRKADIMTDTAGVRLGKILTINYSWSEAGSGFPPRPHLVPLEKTDQVWRLYNEPGD